MECVFPLLRSEAFLPPGTAGEGDGMNGQKIGDWLRRHPAAAGCFSFFAVAALIFFSFDVYADGDPAEPPVGLTRTDRNGWIPAWNRALKLPEPKVKK
mgnify:CR=1 FL=1